MPADPARRQAGFTLLEILVVLVVLGLLLATLAEGTQFGLRAWQSQARTLAERADLDTVDRTLRTLIERLSPGGQPGEAPSLTGSSRRVSFRTELPMVAGALATREAIVGIAVDPAHRLQLRYLSYYRNPIGPSPSPAEALLLDAVDHIEISYFRPGGGRLGGDWLTAWSEPTPPRLIRIRIVFLDPTRRRWPDIVAAPQRKAWRL